MSIRPDMEDLASEIGVAMEAAPRMVEIDRETFEEFMALAKRGHCSVKVAINSALAQWLGRT